MDQVEEKEKEISREYDYSNSVPEIKAILYLAQYCEAYYKQLVKLVEEDEAKNEKLKYDYRNYMFKKSFSSRFEVTIKKRDANYTILYCKTYESFVNAVNEGHANNVNGITITLDLSYERGKEFYTKKHDNLFIISFKPYEIIFSRKSNYEDENMDQIENSINEVLKKFNVQNTIFCTK